MSNDNALPVGKIYFSAGPDLATELTNSVSKNDVKRLSDRLERLEAQVDGIAKLLAKLDEEFRDYAN